jgi:signal peptidase I
MRSLALLLLPLLCAFGAPLASAEVPAFLPPSTYKSFRAIGIAMEPTIAAGDVLLADTNYFAENKPRIGDVVVYRSKSIENGPTVKRIVALGGSKVQLKGGKLIVDDRAVAEPYLKIQGAITTYSQAWGPIELPAGCIFLLGDYRDHSQDSRVDGCSFVSDLIGLVKYAAPSADLGNIREVR